MNLSELLKTQARQYGDKPFLIFERQPIRETETTAWEREFSYRRFDAEVNRAARFLLDIGLQRGDCFNLHLPNSPTFMLLWFAGARISATMMPTNVQSSTEEMRFLLSHSGSRLAFATDAHLVRFDSVREHLPALKSIIRSDPYTDAPADGTLEAALASYSDAPLDELATTEALASIMYTSGTTSRPKGVMVTHENYIKAGQTVADALQLTDRDRHFVVLPLFHGNAQYYSTMSALLRGASMALMDRFSASQFFDRCIAHQCTVASLFSAPIRMILAQPERAAHGNNRLRAVLYAQNLEAGELSEWQRRFDAPLAQLWGMTETMGPPLMNPLHGERRNQTVGLPVGGYEVQLLDSDGNPVETGETGEIVVRGIPGKTIMAGYFKNGEATRDAIRDGWLYTGDNALQDEAGYFRFVDRKKDMIKRSGENVSAGEVEAVLQRHPAVFEVAVIGLPDRMRDEQIVAVVVPHKGVEVSELELIAYCAHRLASFRVPEEVVFRDKLPRTPVGKIQKHLLRQAIMEQD